MYLAIVWIISSTGDLGGLPGQTFQLHRLVANRLLSKSGVNLEVGHVGSLSGEGKRITIFVTFKSGIFEHCVTGSSCAASGGH